MFCSKCGINLENDSRFCFQCGAATSIVEPFINPLSLEQEWESSYTEFKHTASQNADNQSKRILNLKGNARKAAFEKPPHWELILLGESLNQELSKSIDLKRDMIYGVSFGIKKNFMSPIKLIDWMLLKNKQLKNTMEIFVTLFNEALPIALGAPGEPGDADYIVYIAERVGAVYKEFVKWGLEYRSIAVNKDCENLLSAFFEICISPIRDIDNFYLLYSQELQNLFSKSLQSNSPISMHLSLNFSVPDISKVEREIDLLENKYK
ncbi:MAG: zinc ribbon domain-containing protein [Eubacteriales bacterium]